MRFLKLEELNDLKVFLKKHWKKNHIFLKSKKLLKWQHISQKDKIDFYVKKKNKKILSVLGIINQSRDAKYSEISLAIWIAKEKSTGVKLFLDLQKKYNCKIIKGTTVKPKIVPIYNLLGFKVKKFNIYYLKPKKTINNFLSKNLILKKIKSKKNLLNIYKKKIKNKVNISDFKYFSWRFFKHPFYQYKYLSDETLKLILIYRTLKINKKKIMRIVDFIGTFKNKKKFIDSLNYFLKINNFEYLEFFHYGYEDKFIIKSGLNRLNKNQKIVVHNEPFTNLSSDNFYCCYKYNNNLKKIKIVRADGDFDRPSIIR